MTWLMELPPVTISNPSPAALPPVVTATVEAVLGNNQYQVNLQGILLKLELDFLLSIGDKISLRVREQTPDKLVLQPLAPSAKDGAGSLEPDELPARLREIAQEFLRMRAP